MIIIKQVLKFMDENYDLALLITDACNESLRKVMTLNVYYIIYLGNIIKTIKEKL